MKCHFSKQKLNVLATQRRTSSATNAPGTQWQGWIWRPPNDALGTCHSRWILC